MTDAQREKWKKMGLIGKDGNVVGRGEFIENPYLWAQKYLAGVLKNKLGADPKEAAVLQELGGLFGNRVAAQMAQMLTIAKSQMEKDRDLIEKASGIDSRPAFAR